MQIAIGIIFGIVSMLSWGASDFFVTKSARGTNLFKAFFWSQIIALCIMLPIFLIFFKLPQFSISIILLILASGILTVIANLSFYRGLQVGKVSVIMPVESCWAIVTVLLSLTLLSEVLTGMQATGIILILAGAVLVSFKWRNLLKIKNPAKGIKYAIIAAIAYGIDFVIIDLLAKQIGWFLPIFFIGAITAAYMLIFSGTTKKDISFPKNVTWFIILVGILDTVAYLAYSSGVTSEFGSIVAPIGAASPVVAIILAKIFFKENIEMNQITGIVAVILGLILVSL